MALIFDLGELDTGEDEEAASGGKGKKGKKSAVSDEDGPTPAEPPEDAGDEIDKKSFVEYISALF